MHRSIATLAPQVPWELDARLVHLNHGSFGAQPTAVKEHQQALRNEMERNPVGWFSNLPARVAEARAGVAELLNVPARNLAFVLNATAGASVVFSSLVGPTPINVLVTDHGYGAVAYGAGRLAERTGGLLHTVPIPLDAPASHVAQLVAEAIDQHRPHLLVIDQITSATGRTFPTDEICRAARDQGVLTLVDGAHAPGLLADPVCREADYWVGNLHKFWCAPRGTAVIVTRGEGQELYPSIDSWGTPLDFPHRFDTQGTLDVTGWLSAVHAWNYLDEKIGWNEIRRYSRAVLDDGVALVAEALSSLVDNPIPNVGQPVGSMRLLRLPSPLGLTQPRADAMRVPFTEATDVVLAFTTFAGAGYLRISTHAYTTGEDFEALARVGIPVLGQWAGRES